MFMEMNTTMTEFMMEQSIEYVTGSSRMSAMLFLRYWQKQWCKKIEIKMFDKWLISLDRVTYDRIEDNDNFDD